MLKSVPLRILFGDGDLAATRPLRVELRRRGAQVELAQTVPDLRDRSAAAPPDLLVLDESLQGEGENDVVTFLEERHPETEIILLHSGDGAALHGPGRGLLFSARKPVAKESMLEVIVSAFPGHLDESPVPAPQAHPILCVETTTPSTSHRSRDS